MLHIALVRALLAKPSLLILDEAFAYMDDASIDRVLSIIPRDIISIVVSKNPVVNKFVDKSFRLKDGIIA
ncbi:MAG: ABC transporter ATP-binding protein [Marinilabiliaceae bacterium]|nr:ABC transporter ATP-binding protein [Marinilabiliaceae bacterium]